MAGVLGVRQAARVRARRRVPDGSRRLLAECFMRPLVVVLSAEALEAALLAAAGAGGRPGRLRPPRGGGALGGPLLPRLAWGGALLGRPAPGPPGGPPAQPTAARRAERCPR